ncbi:DUF1097 domain-containing protein [Sulfurovum sp. CS9]|uniref:DUF1097 domain-containing protein n=1 Tax=Sulfurovum sp. CS9 TaxID=3391146 RepID=UPI0039EBAB08
MITFALATTLGVVAAISVFISSSLALPTWVLFIAWTSYYLFEANLKSASIVLVQQILGIFIAIVIQYGGTRLSHPLGELGFPLMVFVVMTAIFYISKLKYINNIPAYFLGMIVWFGSQTEPNLKTIIVLSLTLIAGYFFAWLNIIIGQKIQEKLLIKG